MIDDELESSGSGSGSEGDDTAEPPKPLNEKQEEIVKAHEAWLDAHEPKNHPWKVRARIDGDWTHADMTTYRARLASLARSEHVAISSAGHPVRSTC